MIRAEAAAEDKMGALDLALDKMAAQMRRAADRRREHKHKHDRVADLLDAGLDAGPAADDDRRHRAAGRSHHGDR